MKRSHWHSWLISPSGRVAELFETLGLGAALDVAESDYKLFLVPEYFTLFVPKEKTLLFAAKNKIVMNKLLLSLLNENLQHTLQLTFTFLRNF